MFVYLLRHATEPRFKIGKANDIYQRIPAIGGMSSFDLERSLCLQLPSESEAYRLEKVLHRLFDPWLWEIDESKRYPGDTEQFKIECLDRVLKFLTENTDLIGGFLPLPLPPPKVSTKSIVSPEEIERRKAEKKAAHIAHIDAHHGDTLTILKKLVEYIESGTLLCGVWESTSEPDVQRFFICVKDNEQCLEFVRSRLIQTYLIPSGGGLTSIFGSCRYCGSIGIHSFNVDALGAEVPEGAVAQYPHLVQQLEEMTKIVRELPRIDDHGVFSLLKEAGLVDPVEQMGVDGLMDRIRRVMLYVLSEQMPIRLGHGSGSLEHWIVTYCIWGLTNLGISEDSIRESLVSIREKAKRDLKRMKREIDPMWGHYVYKTPVCL